MPGGNSTARPTNRAKRDAMRAASPETKQRLAGYNEQDRNYRDLMAKTERTIVDAGVANQYGFPGSRFGRKSKETLPIKFNKGGKIKGGQCRDYGK